MSILTAVGPKQCMPHAIQRPPKLCLQTANRLAHLSPHVVAPFARVLQAPVRTSPRTIQRPVHTHASSEAGEPASNSTALAPTKVFGSIERQIADTFGSLEPDPGGDWREVEGCWVLFPKEEPKVVVHFIGGAFVGAAPQLTYRLFLECLAARGVVVIATPFATSFDHIRIADETQFKANRCLSRLSSRLGDLPVYGAGHSMGALLHMIINSRYVLPRTGNVLLSYNNRPATDSIPFLSPFIVPSVKAVGPVLTMLARSPLASTAGQRATDLLNTLGPSAVRQVLPLLQQLEPVYRQVADGRQEFQPTPNETKKLIRNYYAIPRNLLLRFADDALDQTSGLAEILQSGAASNMLDLTIRSLPGDHVRPMQQDIPPEVVHVANSAVSQGTDLLSRFTSMASQAGLGQASAPLETLAKNMSDAVSQLSETLTPNAAQNMELLAEEVVAWMTTQKKSPLSLPTSTYPSRY